MYNYVCYINLFYIFVRKWSYMIYNSTEYQLKFHPNKSNRTVRRMISSGLIPSNHIAVKSRDWFVYVDENLSACIEFHAKKTGIDNHILATVLSIKYRIDKKTFFKYLGL